MERWIVVFFAPLAGGVLVPPAHAQDLGRCGGAIERPLNPAQGGPGFGPLALGAP